MLKTYRPVDVPQQFRPAMPFPYPPNNAVEFERWYYENFRGITEERLYLPVFWTAYYVRHQIDKSTNRIENDAWCDLQNWINNNLDVGFKYYTIVQHDDGILHDFGALDVKVFTMGSTKPEYKSAYTIPLIANPHPWDYNNKRIYLASFIGKLTHPIRQEMKVLYNKDEEILFSTEKTSQKTYCEIMSRSIFALCPRGYGPTSFRIQEAIQYGAIPIYISDEFIEPYDTDFNTYGFRIGPQDVKHLKKILYWLVEKGASNLPTKSMWHYYTYTGCKEMMLKNLD